MLNLIFCNIKLIFLKEDAIVFVIFAFFFNLIKGILND